MKLYAAERRRDSVKKRETEGERGGLIYCCGPLSAHPFGLRGPKRLRLVIL